MPQQAFSPSYRSPRAGYRQRGSSSLYYTDGSKTGARIDARPQAARMMGGPSEGPLAPRGNQFLPNRPKTRQDNIDAARLDGTFDAKRAAYNAANKGSYMDERGVIGPKAPLSNNNLGNESAAVAPTAPSTAAATTTIGQAQSMREAGAPIPGQDRWGRTAQSPSAKGVPASQFNQANPSSSARGEWQSGGPSRHYGTSSVSFAPKTTTSPSPSGTTAGTDANGKPVSVAPRPSGIGAVDAVNSLPSKQQSGAMFKGDDGKWKTRAEWFGDAAKRQGQDNAYSNEALAQAKSGQAPYAPGSVEARAQALGNAMKTAQQGNQIVANLPKTPSSPNEQGVSTSYTTKETRPGDIDVVPKVKPPTSPNAQGLSDVIAKRQSQTAAPVNKLPPQPGIIRDDNPAPSSNASWFSSASKSLTQGAQTMMNDRAAKEAKLAEAEQRAKPGMEKVADVAKGASVGAFTAATTPAKAIATPVQATIAGAQEAGRKIGETVNKAVQGVKTFMQGDQSAAQEAAKLKAELNPPPAPSIAGDEEKKKRVATR